MGRTEFLTETDCERALVGRAKAKASTRAKWRSSSSACRRVLEKCLTPPTLLEMAIFRQLANCVRWIGLPTCSIDNSKKVTLLAPFGVLFMKPVLQSRRVAVNVKGDVEFRQRLVAVGE